MRDSDDDEENALGPADASPKEMRRRERAWMSSGDPMALWPGLSHDALQSAANDIGRAVSALARDDHASLGRQRRYDARALGVGALLTGVGPMLGHWVEIGALDVDDDVAALLARHLNHGRRRAERIGKGLEPVFRALVAAEVTPTLFKGLHTAREYFPEPGTRPSADADIVVHPADVSIAARVLASARFVRGREAPDLGKGDWAPPDDDGIAWSFERWDARSRWALELHTRLELSHLWTDPRPRVLGPSDARRFDFLGIPVRVLRQPLLVASLATHASGEMYNVRLLRALELTLVMRKDSENGTLDWAGVEDLLGRADALRFAYPALALTDRLLPGLVDEGLLARARTASTRRARTVTDGLTLTSPILQRHVSLTEKLMWTATPRQTLLRLLEMVTPVRHGSWRDVATAYHDRLTRIIAGRLRLGAEPSVSPEDVAPARPDVRTP